MLAGLLPLLCCFLFSPQRSPVEPYLPVGLWYAGPGVQPPGTVSANVEATRSELASIRRAGFNSITTWINWRDAEPKRGAYAFAPLERLIAAAAQSELQIDVRVFTDAAPAWTSDVSADRARFISYAISRLRLAPQVGSVEHGEPAGDLARAIRVGREGKSPIEARVEFWAAISRGARRVTFLDTAGGVGPSVLSLGETVGIVTRNQALFAPLLPRQGAIRDVTGGSGTTVDVRLLESTDALVIIGVNYAPAPQKVTISFTPEIPEAIWQNMETGTSVNFVMGKTGPFLEHTFTPRDALVLMIRKKLR